MGSKKTRELLNSRFTWPGLGRNVQLYTQSCDLCLRFNKCGSPGAKMVERPVISEPFESVAIDLVIPLPKGKRGCRFILSYICLATKWPEAMLLRSGSAVEVVEALTEIFLKRWDSQCVCYQIEGKFSCPRRCDSL